MMRHRHFVLVETRIPTGTAYFIRNRLRVELDLGDMFRMPTAGAGVDSPIDRAPGNELAAPNGHAGHQTGLRSRAARQLARQTVQKYGAPLNAEVRSRLHDFDQAWLKLNAARYWWRKAKQVASTPRNGLGRVAR